MCRLISLAVVALTAASLTGCPGPVEFINMGLDASYDAETPESVGMAPANYRGRSCSDLAYERERANSTLNFNPGNGKDYSYAHKHFRWQVASISQVEMEQGCPSVAPTEAIPPSPVKGVPLSAAERGSVSPTTGLPQTSISQWLVKETVEKYQDRSCEYLQMALSMSVRAEATADADARSLAAAQKKAVGEVLATRSCPPPVPFLSGRLGAKISAVDPIKAARLGMPLSGASIEQVTPGSSASRVGLMFADVVVAVGETRVGDDIDFLVALNKIPTGSTVVLKVWRNGAYGLFPAVLGQPTQ